MRRNRRTVPKANHIDLRKGKFEKTSADDLAQAFVEFEKSKKNHLCVFFHGGLVSRAEGQAQAAELMPGYANAGAYPFFFIWNSDLWTALSKPTRKYSRNIVFRRVVEQHLVFIAATMLRALAPEDSRQHPLWAIATLPRAAAPLPLTTLAAFGRIADSVWVRRSARVSLNVRPAELRAFERQLAQDPSIRAHGGLLDNKTRFTVQKGEGLVRRVIRRFRKGRDHGLYTTIVEELLRIAGADRLCASVWENIQSFIDDSFNPNANKVRWGGTAFVENLAASWDKDMRLTLVAHSAGAIYVGRMLTEIAKLPQDIKADVVLVAAGISFEKLGASIDLFKNKFRFFALKDEYEGGYPEIPPLYDKSLLYFVSALCERDRYMDREMVGMQRYWCGKGPYDTRPVRRITSKIPPAARVWSPTGPVAPPGFRAKAEEHGGFAEETETDGSVQDFLKNG